MFSRTAWLRGIGVSRPRGPGFHGGGCGLGTRPVLTGVLSGMGSVICGGGLAFDVTVAYEKPPGAGAGVGVGGGGEEGAR